MRADRSRFEVYPVTKNKEKLFTWTLYDKYGRVRIACDRAFTRVNNTRRDAIRTRRKMEQGEIPIINVEAPKVEKKSNARTKAPMTAMPVAESASS